MRCACQSTAGAVRIELEVTNNYLLFKGHSSRIDGLITFQLGPRPIARRLTIQEEGEEVGSGSDDREPRQKLS